MTLFKLFYNKNILHILKENCNSFKQNINQLIQINVFSLNLPNQLMILIKDQFLDIRFSLLNYKHRLHLENKTFLYNNIKTY